MTCSRECSMSRSALPSSLPIQAATEAPLIVDSVCPFDTSPIKPLMSLSGLFCFFSHLSSSFEGGSHLTSTSHITYTTHKRQGGRGAPSARRFGDGCIWPADRSVQAQRASTPAYGKLLTTIRLDDLQSTSFSKAGHVLDENRLRNKADYAEANQCFRAWILSDLIELVAKPTPSPPPPAAVTIIE